VVFARLTAPRIVKLKPSGTDADAATVMRLQSG
jgi:hypothetical protein